VSSSTVIEQRSNQLDSVDIASCSGCGSSKADVFLVARDRFHGRARDYTLRRCGNCSLVWLDAPPSPQEMGQHYGPDYDRWIGGAGEDPSHWRERRNTLLKYKVGGSILDLGCSAGGFLTSMKSPAWKLHGIEMSDEVARKAEARCGAQVFVGDILDAPFAAESFDAITCFHVFEHLYHPREVLERVSNWLKPGGIFYTMMPNIDSAGARIFKSYWYALELPRHLYQFSPKSLGNLAQSVGLGEVSVTTHREVFIEYSTRYVLDEVCARLGIARLPLAQTGRPSLPWRIVRKGFRLSILPVLNGLAGLAGDGESIHAVFQKTR